MIVGVPKETFPGERRVAFVPAHVPQLAKAGFTLLFEPGAGVAAGIPDDHLRAKGAEVATDRADLFRRAEVIAQVRTSGSLPEAGPGDLELLREGQVLIGFSDPLSHPDRLEALAAKNVAVLSMELMPRITRAQSMDALSSSASIVGYKAVVMAAEMLPRIFPMMMTAAGTLTPARVLVIGAGVAGLQAIATAKRLGAVVTAYDVRPAAKEQVVSLGGKFLELGIDNADAEDKGGYARERSEDDLKRQRELMTQAIAESDVVITTALVPGRKAPTLVTADQVRAMSPGSVVIDIAAEKGGNCELTKPDERVDVGGVTVYGPTNVAATVPFHSSQTFSKNVANFLLHLGKEGTITIDPSDEITAATMLTQGGVIVHPRIRELLGLPPLEAPAADEPTTATESAPAPA